MLLPWFSQFPLLKPCSIIIFLRWGGGFLCPLISIIYGIIFFYSHHHQYTFFHLFIYSFVSIIRIITIVTIRINFFSVYLFLSFFAIECLATCLKNSYIFSKSGGDWEENWSVCYYQGGHLVFIETEEEWQFINYEIQKRGSWNTSAWHIGLWKRGVVWTWKTGEQLNISK